MQASFHILNLGLVEVRFNVNIPTTQSLFGRKRVQSDFVHTNHSSCGLGKNMEEVDTLGNDEHRSSSYT